MSNVKLCSIVLSLTMFVTQGAGINNHRRLQRTGAFQKHSSFQRHNFSDAFPDIEGIRDKCVLGGVAFRQSCYGFGQVRVTWDIAIDFCKMFGGYLAEISDRLENDFVANELAIRGFDSSWLGGSDIFHEGVWQWKTSSLTIGSTDRWDEGQPDNLHGRENCLGIHKSSGLWSDYDCNHRTFFVCETRLHAPITKATF